MKESHKLKILVVNYEWPPIGGGGGRVSFEISKYIKHRADLDVFTVAYPYRNIYPIHIKGVRTFAINCYRKSIHQIGISGVLSYLINSIIPFYKLIRRNQYDLIHYYFSIPTGLLSILQPKYVPYIISLNGGDVPNYNPGEFQLLHKITRKINSYICRKANLVTAVSSNLGEYAQKQLKFKDYCVIYNGIDETKAPGRVGSTEQSTLKLISVSRLVSWKHIDLIIKAIVDIADVELSIIGEGREKENLQLLVSELNIDDKVNIIGYVPNADINNYLIESDIFILPSSADSFGIVFLEAMACGLPIIAAKAGGVPEVVKDGINGILVEPNDVESLKNAIIHLVENKSLRKSYGNNSLMVIKNQFTWNIAASKTLELYEKYA
jgi:L-malate glycosyltransferase